MIMYALLNSEGQIQTYPYSVSQLRADNPGTSFPVDIPEERLADWNVVPVQVTTQPEYNHITQDLIEQTPENVDGVWTQVWSVVDVSAETVAERTADYNASQKASRNQAYQQEADPLFFKWQRGEGTEAEWLAKVAEIKVRYPYL
jgi:hypothetical protein